MLRNIYLLILLSCLCGATSIHAAPASNSVNIILSAADGQNIKTREIQSAIDSCHQDGGGVVVFSGGTFLTGSIQLKSNVTVIVEAGAAIKGSADLNDYPFHKSSHLFGPDDMKMRSLIWADNAENIRICGNGTIDGSGQSPQFDIKQQPRPVRPIVMRLISCKNTLIEGITLKSSPMWMQQYVNCEQLRIRNIIVFNHSNRNNDGLDIVGCREVQITGCNISSDDDALCFKTLSNAGNKNILVADCILASNCNALKIGTETSADHSNFTISNCIIKKTGVFSETWKRDIGVSGLAIESVDGANISNVIVSGLVITGVYMPLFVRLGNRGRKYAGTVAVLPPGSISNISLNHIIGVAERPMGNIISGIEGRPIENLKLFDISLTSVGGGLAEHLFLDVPEKEADYPEVTMFGKTMPSHGAYIRHVNGLTMSHVDFRYLNDDVRPALILDKVEHAAVGNINADTQTTTDCVIRLINSRHIDLQDVRLTAKPRLFLRIEGEKSHRITLRDEKRELDLKQVNFENTTKAKSFKLIH